MLDVIIEESKSIFIDKLIAKFGYDTIYSTSAKTFVLANDQMLKDIYYIANKVIFSNKLPLLDIMISAKCKSYEFGKLHYTYVISEATKRCLIYDQKYSYYEDDGTLIECKPPYLMFNADSLSKSMPLIIIVNVVLHEMIHIYNLFCGKTLKKIYIEKTRGKPKYDSHDIDFIKMMSDINIAHGTNILTTFNMKRDLIPSIKRIHKFDNIPLDIDDNDVMPVYEEEITTNGLSSKNVEFKVLVPGKIFSVTEIDYVDERTTI